ncbi:MAG: hypothetical protein SWO11_17790 [Thermodesulfobacteriota bacterium]|nr:hypothetical protein [Thermodesulfobacteriota bacterium]
MGKDYSTSHFDMTLSGTCALDTIIIYVNGFTAGVTYTYGETTWSYTSTLEVDKNTFYITAEDAAGNVSDAGSIKATYSSPSDNTPSDQSVLSSRTDGASNISLTPTLQTATFCDPDSGDTHGATRWQISKTNGDFSESEMVFDETSTTDLTSFIVPTYFSDKRITYYRRVTFF